LYFAEAEVFIAMRFFTLGKRKNYENRICKKYKIRGSCVEPKNPIPQLLALSKKNAILRIAYFLNGGADEVRTHDL
jgi:hypothetical protein